MWRELSSINIVDSLDSPGHHKRMSNTIPPEELDAIYAFAVQLGKDAGQMLLEAAEARYDGSGVAESNVEKESAVDIVTQTDEGW